MPRAARALFPQAALALAFALARPALADPPEGGTPVPMQASSNSPPPSPGAPAPALAERRSGPLSNPSPPPKPPPRRSESSGPLAERQIVPPSPPPPASLAERPNPVPNPQPDETSAKVSALLKEGDARLQRGDSARAEKLYQDALALLPKGSKRLDKDSLAVAAAESRLSQIYRDRTEYARAHELAERVLAIREKILGREHLDTAEAADNLAWLHWQEGDYRRAEPLAERALAVRERAFHGEPSEHLAVSLTTLGVLLWEEGAFGRAEALLLRARDVEEKLHGGPHQDVAIALDNLGGLYADKGDFASAERLFTRALSIRESTLDPKNPDIAVPLSYLGNAALEREDYEKAEQLYTRAHAIWKAAYSEEHPRFIHSLESLGKLYVIKGDHARAEPLLLRAVQISEKVLGKQHPSVGTYVDALATLYREMGAFARARPYAERSLAIRRAAYGDNHTEVAVSREHLASLSLAEGNIEAAIEERARAAAILDHHTALLLATGAEEQKRAYMATLRKSTDEIISMHARHGRSNPRAAALALTTILRRKGRVLDAMTDGFGALRRRLAPGDQALLDELAKVRAELGALVLRGLGKLPLEQYLAKTTALEAEQERLEAQVSARSAEFRGEERPVTLEQVQAAIPGDSALVEFVIYAPFDEKARTPETRRGAPRYAAYVLKRSGEPAFLDLGEAAPLDAAAAELRGALSDSTVDPRPKARALDALLMQPLRALLGGTRSLLLSPDGKLNLLPFAALIDEDDRYLLSRYTFTYLTSGRELVRRKALAGPGKEASSQAGAPPPLSAVIIADPAFGPLRGPAMPSESRGRRSVDMTRVVFPPLPGTLAEGRAIEGKLATVSLLTGPKATESAVKALRGPSIVHIATHGFFLPSAEAPKAERSSGPNASGGSSPRSAAAELAVATGVMENPLLRAGLAFAGANLRESGSDDGVLTALEASSLDLRGTQLIVLSACETGVGEAQRGEGVYGLRRALSIAGAETQVMSLWKVDDDATRALMVAYYAELAAGRGKSEAMHEAQRSLSLKKATMHPYYWASFVVSGDDGKLAGLAADPAVPKVSSGPRGCSCTEVGHSGELPPALSLAMVAALTTVVRRRHGRALGREVIGVRR